MNGSYPSVPISMLIVISEGVQEVNQEEQKP